MEYMAEGTTIPAEEWSDGSWQPSPGFCAQDKRRLEFRQATPHLNGAQQATPPRNDLKPRLPPLRSSSNKQTIPDPATVTGPGRGPGPGPGSIQGPGPGPNHSPSPDRGPVLLATSTRPHSLSPPPGSSQGLSQSSSVPGPKKLALAQGPPASLKASRKSLLDPQVKAEFLT
nr:proline-rich protein HaeIII subfamily 1-like [Rhipicephalus microplus]